jgi:hypothetical protein
MNTEEIKNDFARQAAEVEAACAKLSECAEVLGRIRALDY